MNLPPPPQLRGILASALFVLLAVSVSENAGAQVGGEVCEPGRIAAGQNPHTADDAMTHIGCMVGTRLSGHRILTEPSSIACGRCTAGGCGDPATHFEYVIGNTFFCGPASQCAAGGGRREGNLHCTEDRCADGYVDMGTGGNRNCVLNLNQVCYDADFRMPIAAGAFSGNPGSGDCRRAETTDTSACAQIDPGGSVAALGDFTTVLDGACAQAECTNPASFRMTPGLAAQQSGKRGDLVGRCFGQDGCQDDFNGIADTTTRECREMTGADCPAGQVLTGGACAPCGANQSPNGDRNACVCDMGYEEIGGECTATAGMCGSGAGSRSGTDPHTSTDASNSASICVEAGGFGGEAIITAPGHSQCGICQSGSVCDGNMDWIRYKIPGSDHVFCAAEAQCADKDGRIEGNLNCAGTACAAGFMDTDPGGGMTCEPEPTAEHHQACYDHDFRAPIATRAFDTSLSAPPAGACQAATNDDADVCMAIDPSPQSFTSVGDFVRVLDGVCARAECTQADIDIGSFNLLLEVITHARRAEAGRCTNDPDGCRDFYNAFVDTENNQCRFPTNNTECGNVDPDTPIHDATEDDRCRAANSINDCAMGEVFNAVCEVPDTAEECARAKDVSYVGINSSGVCVSSCAAPNVLDTSMLCRLPMSDMECSNLNGLMPKHDESEATNCRTLTDAECASQVADATVEGNCRDPRNGPECERATGDAAMNVYDDSFTGADRCRTSCSASREPRANMANVCTDRTEDDCNNDQYFDEADERTCKVPAEVAQCGQVRTPIPNAVFEDNACAAGCNDDRQADANSVCQPPSEAHCQMTQEVVDGDSCVAPDSGTECRTARRDTSFYDPAPGVMMCVGSCGDGRIGPAPDFNCRDLMATDCTTEPNTYFDSTGSDPECRAPETGTECRGRQGAGTNEVYEPQTSECQANCEGTRVASSDDHTCEPLGQSTCTGLFYDSGTDECREPVNGTECRAANAGQEVYDDSFAEGSRCQEECSASREERTGQSDPSMNHNCTDRVTTDCNDNEYVDEASANRDCVTPTEVSQCSLVKMPIPNAVFEGGACAENCNGHRVADTNNMCQDPMQTDCSARMDGLTFLPPGETVCRAPANGDECQTANAGQFFDADSSPSCVETVPAGEVCPETEDYNCRATALSDCGNGQFLNGSNVCETPDTGAECRLERQGETRDQTLVYESEGGAGCVSSCSRGREPNAEFTCQNSDLECSAEANQEPNAAGTACDCEEDYADSDTSTPELTCTLTPDCASLNQELNTAINECGGCRMGFEDPDNAEPLECVRVCVDPEVRQPDGSCAVPTARTLADCADTQKLSSGECEDLTSADCLPAEKFENGMCVLLEPEDGASLTPPYGDGYTAATCTDANWPWSIVQTADGLSELCHAPVNLLATEVPSSQTLNDAGEQLDFCVLRGAESGDSVRCDDPTVFGSLGIPRAPEGLVAQITTVITITLADESTREASVVTASVANYLEIVHVSGSVVAVLPPDTTAAEITTADPLVGTISLEMPDPGTMSVTPPPATNTMTPPATNTVAPPPPAADGGGGGSGGGGGGAAAALIAVPVVLLGGYWLLGGFEFINPAYDFSYRGENEDFHYSTSGGFDLNHGNLNSYARAIQSNGDAVSYESGISYKEDFYSLNYAAYESDSVYDYDLAARLTYGDGPWSISPTADAEFHYQDEDWATEASAGISAVWTAHRWNIKASSAFAGKARHGLDLEYRF